ncbi:hypothetical protein LTS17_003751 [Exophiala oligosperma]
MLSKSARLRQVSQTVHSWPFSWARRLGMFEVEEYRLQDLPDVSDPLQTKLEKWKTWAALECRRRAVHGLFIIDAHLARYSGGFPVGKHVLNPLPLTAVDAIFEARTVDDWITQMRQHWTQQPSFRNVYLSIFGDGPLKMPVDSLFSIFVLLEGLQAVITESNLASGQGVGLPSKKQIQRALIRTRNALQNGLDPGVDTLEIYLRWHALCLDHIIDTSRLQRELCRHRDFPQNIFTSGMDTWKNTDHLRSWTKSTEGRKALLHGIAIQDIAQRLSIGRAYGAGTLAAVLAAGTIYCTFCTVDQHDVAVPRCVNWNLVADWDDDYAHGDNSLQVRECRAFFQGKLLPSGCRRLNLRLSLYQLQTTLRTMSAQWGIAEEMRHVLLHWTSLGLGS